MTAYPGARSRFPWRPALAFSCAVGILCGVIANAVVPATAMVGYQIGVTIEQARWQNDYRYCRQDLDECRSLHGSCASELDYQRTVTAEGCGWE